MGGATQAFSLDGHVMNIRIPEENSGSVGMIIGDPCITVDRWCKFGGVFQTKTTLWRVLNGLSKFELDYWILNGDLFYDQSGSLTKEFFAGLDATAMAKISAVTMGNHDFWIGGHPGGSKSDSFANGHMQMYAQDAVSAKDDPSVPFDFSKNPDAYEQTSIKNVFWYNKIGNAGVIGFSNAYSWDESKPYFEEACQWVESARPAFVVLVAHWNSQDDGCASGMADPDAISKIRGLGGCSNVPMKYFEGHAHCNQKKLPDGVMLGAWGFDGCGDFGIPLLDTRNDQAILWYFEMGSGGHKNSLFDTILKCLEAHGLDGCKHMASPWFTVDLPTQSLTVTV